MSEIGKGCDWKCREFIRNLLSLTRGLLAFFFFPEIIDDVYVLVWFTGLII